MHHLNSVRTRSKIQKHLASTSKQGGNYQNYQDATAQISSTNFLVKRAIEAAICLMSCTLMAPGSQPAHRLVKCNNIANERVSVPTRACHLPSVWHGLCIADSTPKERTGHSAWMGSSRNSLLVCGLEVEVPHAGAGTLQQVKQTLTQSSILKDSIQSCEFRLEPKGHICNKEAVPMLEHRYLSCLVVLELLKESGCSIKVWCPFIQPVTGGVGRSILIG